MGLDSYFRSLAVLLFRFHSICSLHFVFVIDLVCFDCKIFGKNKKKLLFVNRFVPLIKKCLLKFRKKEQFTTIKRDQTGQSVAFVLFCELRFCGWTMSSRHFYQNHILCPYSRQFEMMKLSIETRKKTKLQSFTIASG